MQVHAMWLLIPSWVGGNLVPSLCEEEEMSLGMGGAAAKSASVLNLVSAVVLCFATLSLFDQNLSEPQLFF